MNGPDLVQIDMDHFGRVDRGAARGTHCAMNGSWESSKGGLIRFDTDGHFIGMPAAALSCLIPAFEGEYRVADTSFAFDDSRGMGCDAQPWAKFEARFAEDCSSVMLSPAWEPCASRAVIAGVTTLRRLP